MNIRKKAIKLMLLSSALHLAKVASMDKDNNNKVASMDKDNNNMELNKYGFFSEESENEFFENNKDFDKKPDPYALDLMEKYINEPEEETYYTLRDQLDKIFQNCGSIEEFIEKEPQGSISEKAVKFIIYFRKELKEFSKNKDVVYNDKSIIAKFLFDNQRSLIIKFGALLSFLDKKTKEDLNEFSIFLANNEIKYYYGTFHHDHYNRIFNNLIIRVTEEIAQSFFNNNTEEAVQYLQSIIKDKNLSRQIKTFNKDTIYKFKLFAKVCKKHCNNIFFLGSDGVI